MTHTFPLKDVAKKSAQKTADANSTKPNRSRSFRRLTRIALQSTALAPFVLLATPAWASCSYDSKYEYTVCSGNPFPFLYQVPADSSEYVDYVFKDLNTNPSNGSYSAVIELYSTGAEGKNHGDNGKQGTPIGLYYDVVGYTMNSSKSSIVVLSTGGKGHSGKDREGEFGVDGGEGGRGGVGGDLYFSWRHGDITAGTYMEFVSRGGDGGDAGRGKASAGNARGDFGGDGGAGGTVSLDLAEYSDVVYTGGPIRAWSIGGKGGKGGRAVADGGKATGKHGGVGGIGNTVNINIYNDLSFVQGSNQYIFGGLYAFSIAGRGGNGGNASGDASDSEAGNGARGGSGGAINILTGNNGTISFNLAAGSVGAIYALSAGGDGGHGGDGETTIGKGKGGDGGSGGLGGDINIDVAIGEDGLVTQWHETQGVFAQSIGGSGGDGGSGAGNLGSGKGGGGALAGDGGTINVHLNGSFINTQGDESNAIIAQSIGGFAGDGGDASGFVAYSADAQSGGSGGQVFVTLGSGFVIVTEGDSSSGIIAQSIGGGGGRGGSSSGLVSMGGIGSSGGDGGEVHITTYADSSITTFGESSFAIEVQSIGGSGGSAGASKGLVSMGGSAGSGGNGANISIYNKSALSTSGDYSDAVIMQSIGGGGGSAHSTSGMAAIGGSGGDGGNGGVVSFTSYTSTIRTAGADADAIVLQSIGGGGGSGSNAFATGAQFSSAIGGQGGSGGSASSISLIEVQGGAIRTEGDHSTGVMMQSIGGGGGDGGYGISASAGVAFDMSVGAGGSGSHGGSGGTIDAQILSAITTLGDHAVGIQAQSIGGGGGNGGMAISSANTNGVAASAAVGGSGGIGGNGGTVTVSTNGVISTQGHSSTGIMAQSVGGGGGSSGLTIDANAVSNMSAAVAIGRGGGSGGNGSDVSVITSNGITTEGASSDGILAQSIGGAGGNASAVIAASGVSQSDSLNVAVGGAGGSGGNAGKVYIKLDQLDTPYNWGISTDGDGSNGIVGQSIGGSGGNGSLSVAGSLSSNNSIDVSIGGNGGGGGHASSVEIYTSANIDTYGDNAHGILAQSIGGSGGNGGMSIAASAMSGNTANVAVSGSGGSGNTSGDVTVNTNNYVFTYGMHSTAIKAMSIAGGGGNATAAITGSTSQMGEAGVTIGGSGGSGGTAGNVTVNLFDDAVVYTAGDYSDGIWAGSIGGGGGHGAIAAQGSLSAGEYSSTNNVTIGGSGGAGGTAGDVSISTTVGEINNIYDNNIYTKGYQSRGIYASSVGGSGGSGGSAYSGSLVFSEDVGMTVGVSIGGAGGTGGIGGNVLVQNEHNITTLGHYSDGIFAQSVGGNGGAGGNSVVFAGQAAKSSSLNFAVAVGGNGGTGAHAGKVEIFSAGDLTMTGLESHGIYAQSVGGGGGRGGNAGTVLMDATASQKDSSEKNITMNVDVQVGGIGGSGGDGKAVTVYNEGNISVGYQGYEDGELVDDRTAFGIFAQSVGGGGGDGGSVSGYLLSVSGDCTASGLTNYAYQCKDSNGVKSNYAPTLQAAVGGNGASAGDGNTVSVTNNAAIQTSGTGSHAIFAQSVGGGGGVGGYGTLGSTKAIAPNKTVSDVTAKLKTASGKYSNTKQFQTLNIIVGGQGGSGGDGGTVSVNNTGDITTYGDAADAIVAMSVGGGGGHGGTAYSGLGSYFQAAVGGAGSGGGHGGDVTVDSSGIIITNADDAMGIFVQSVGGGGGRAGTVSRALKDVFGTNFNIGKGVGSVLEAGDGGNGGDVDITLAAGGGIWTYGDYAHGIFAQSIGGGGGAAHIEGFENQAFSFAGGNGEDGNGGDITININSAIVVAGYGAHAVFAQSTSGEDDDGDLGTVAGDVTVNVNSSIVVSGEDGRGVLLQSDGFTDSGQIHLTISTEGTIKVGTDGGDAIGLMHGLDNVIENYGNVAKDENSSSTNYALRTYAGQLDFQNSGYFRGSVLLADTDELGLESYTNTFTNNAGGTLALGQEFNLGNNSSILSNAGTMTPKNLSSIGSTSFTGALTQSSSGIYWADFNFEGQADEITIEDGGTAVLEGSVYPYPVETVPADGASGGTLILTAPKDALSADSLTVDNTATVEYTLYVTSGGALDQIVLGYEVDYSGQLTATSATPTYSENFYKVADYISVLAASRREEYDNGGSKFEFVEDLILPILRVPTHDELAEVYWHLTPSDLHRNAEAHLRSSQQFAGDLMSCPDLTGANTYAFRYEGNCAWSQVSASERSINEHGNNLDYDEKTWRYSTGVQFELKEDWFLGGAIALEHADTTTGISTGSIDRFHLGAVLKHEVGNTNYAVSLSAGHSENEITRNVLTGFGGTSEAFNTTDNWVSAHGRVAHLFKWSGGNYFEPYADAGVTWLLGRDATFDGSLPASLDVHRSDLVQYSAQAGFSIGRSIATQKAIYDIGMNFGVLSTFGDDFSSSVNFSDSPGTSLTLNTQSEELVFDIGAHASAQIGEKTSLRLNLGAQLGEHETGYGADFRFSHQF